MYLPEQFEETDPGRIASLVENHPFGMLITVSQGQPFVSHLPFLFERSSGRKGRLIGHMARANPQWQHFGKAALAVFQGPHAYVSPSWYASFGVPTWNYAVVHMKGKAVPVEGEALEKLLEKMTAAQESGRQNPWKLEDERLTKLFAMIVGFEIEITEIRAKFKLSQNRSLDDRTGVIGALSELNDPNAVELVKLMAGND